MGQKIRGGLRMETTVDCYASRQPCADPGSHSEVASSGSVATWWANAGRPCEASVFPAAVFVIVARSTMQGNGRAD